ncbi:MAG: hypothetical protein ACQEQF_04930 [Bacillota bacterium]
MKYKYIFKKDIPEYNVEKGDKVKKIIKEKCLMDCVWCEYKKECRGLVKVEGGIFGDKLCILEGINIDYLKEITNNFVKKYKA